MDDSKNFSLRMALAKYLTPNLRVGLLERRRNDLVGRLAEVRTGANNEQLDTYARSVMPVSYTHLDVYKRQAQTHSPTFRC